MKIKKLSPLLMMLFMIAPGVSYADSLKISLEKEVKLPEDSPLLRGKTGPIEDRPEEDRDRIHKFGAQLLKRVVDLAEAICEDRRAEYEIQFPMLECSSRLTHNVDGDILDVNPQPSVDGGVIFYLTVKKTCIIECAYVFDESVRSRDID